ncbi:hypothetical protein TNCV_2569881 [Trichonephila clavipes]|nr:hypothetical protein TNCV_2569881 [Trichonephila clavipes]
MHAELESSAKQFLDESSMLFISENRAVGSLVVRASDSRPEGPGNCGGGDRWCPSIVPSGNFAELNRTITCMVLKANDRRTSGT